MLIAPMHAGLRGLDRVVLIVDRRRGAGEIVDLVDLHIERKRHVVAHQLEMRVVEQVLDVALGAGEEVVDAQDVMTLCDQTIAQVAAEKAGATGHQNAFVSVVLTCHSLPIDFLGEQDCYFAKQSGSIDASSFMSHAEYEAPAFSGFRVALLVAYGPAATPLKQP